MATLPAVSSTSSNSSSGTTMLSTPSQGIAQGSGIYVQVAMYGTSLATPQVTDSMGGNYALIQHGNTAATGVYLWIFRRTSPTFSSSTFSVTVTPSSSTSSIEVISLEVRNDGGVDALSTFRSGTGTSETSSVATASLNCLVFFLGADNSGIFSVWGGGQTGITGYPGSPPSNVTAWGSVQTQASTGTASSSRTISGSKAWVDCSIAIVPQLQWKGIAAKPFLTVSAIGINVGGAILTNNGADFGPDTVKADGTPTQTNGIQEALNAIPGGGVVFVRAGTYFLYAPIGNTGSEQLVLFDPGAVLEFSSVSATPYENWNNDLGDIWVGCNFTKSSASQASYHDCRWYGNGATINCSGLNYSGGAPVGNNGEIVFSINAYVQTYHVLPSYNIEVDGFVVSGFGGVAIQLANNSFAPYNSALGGPLSQQWRNVRIGHINAVMAANSFGTPFGTGVFFGGCNGVLVHDSIIDCSNIGNGSAPDVSNCFVSCQRGGDTQDVTFERCRFNGGAGSTSAGPGSVLEVQGANAASSRGNTHDITWEDCVFSSGAAAGNPFGGQGGSYIDDTNGGTGSSVVYNLTFRRCQWYNVGMSLKFQSAFAGFIAFEGSAPGAITVLNGSSSPTAGRILIQTPSLWSSDQAVNAIEVPLNATPTVLATYSTPDVSWVDPNGSGTYSPVPRQFRVNGNASSSQGGTVSITVNYTDPHQGNITIATLNQVMGAGAVTSGSVLITASGGTVITAKGSWTGTPSTVWAAASIEQVQ